MEISKLVEGFPRKNEDGLTRSEIDSLVESVPELNLNMKEFESALYGITVLLIDNEHVYYLHDVKKAFNWGLGGKQLFL